MTARGPREHRVDRHVGAVQREPAGVGTDEHEQIVRQPAQAVHLVLGGGQAGPQGRRVAALHARDLELGLQHRERRAQLVARVGHEALLARERRADRAHDGARQQPRPDRARPAARR